MLLAFIVDLILPDTNLKQYVKLVIGILLILIIIEPLLSIFKIDVDYLVEELTFSEQGVVVENEIENEMNSKKNEIESLQSAYVLEEVVVQMKNKVEEELGEDYEAKIINLEVSEDQDSTKEKRNFKNIFVQLDKSNNQSTETVEEVTIQITGSNSEQEAIMDEGQSSEIKTFLAKEWEVDESVITIQWKEE